jgi:hypothetical protein
MVVEVEAALSTQTPAQVSAQFADYQKEFPRIFEMLLTRTYRREFLEMMLRPCGSMPTRLFELNPTSLEEPRRRDTLKPNK